MLTGELMTSATITDRLIELSRALVGRARGGLAQVNIVVSMFFAGMNGSVVADTATVGSILIPAMKRAGYSAAFSAAVTSVSATIGGIIPPSIGMIILATVASLSVGALFSGGIIPGIMIGLTLMVITWFIARRRNYERSDESWNIKRIWRAFMSCFLALSIPIVLVGSIVGGIASPVEAGAITAITAFLLGLFVYRSLDADILIGAVTRAFKTAGAVFIIIAAAGPFSWLLTRLGTLKFVEEFIATYEALFVKDKDEFDTYVTFSATARRTYSRWKRGQSGLVTFDVLERISCILGIYKALHLLFAEPGQADSWLRRANEASIFGGRSALDRMLAGDVADLHAVRQYLDAQRG